MEEWKEYKLGEVAIIVRDRIETSCLNSASYISTENMLPNKAGVTLSSGVPSGSAISFRNEDTLISNIRPYFKKIWRADKEGGCSADVICLRASNDVEPLFLYYLLSQDLFFDYVMQGAKGTKMPRGDRNQIMRWPVLLPSKHEQYIIASFLSALDDKIEVNRKINENLEQQAQALFKSWFVDFEPFRDGEFVESELGMIPKGWRVFELSYFAKISKKTINPSKQPHTLFEHFSIPSYDDGMNPERQYGEDIKSNKFVIDNRMTLFSKLNPRIKRVWYVDKLAVNSICSTEFVPYMAVEESKSSFIYGLINSQGFYDFVMSLVNGATGSHQRFHPEESLKFLIAYNDEYGTKYSAIVTPMINQILTIRNESRRLAELRDTLLPKLMSGELKVNNIEKNI